MDVYINIFMLNLMIHRHPMQLKPRTAVFIELGWCSGVKHCDVWKYDLHVHLFCRVLQYKHQVRPAGHFGRLKVCCHQPPSCFLHILHLPSGFSNWRLSKLAWPKTMSSRLHRQSLGSCWDLFRSHMSNTCASSVVRCRRSTATSTGHHRWLLAHWTTNWNIKQWNHGGMSV